MITKKIADALGLGVLIMIRFVFFAKQSEKSVKKSFGGLPPTEL